MDEEENIFDKLLELFNKRRFAELRMTLVDMEAADIASFIEERLEEKEQIVFFRLLPKGLASDVFVEIDSDTQEELIKAFTDKELKEVIDDMFLDDTVDIIDEMPANVVKRILLAADPEDRKTINELLEYPDDSAGSLMTPEFVSLSANMTVSKAFDKIRRTGVNKETIYTCYVTNVKKQLIGVVTVKDLLLADKETLVENIMTTNVVSVETLEDKEQVALMFQKYAHLALPVIDKEGCIVGIITVDDAVDVMQEEATEDIQIMAAITPDDKPYLKTSPFKIWLNRAPWLLILMISATFTGLILNTYEGEFSALNGGVIGSLLIACVPMMMDSGGNAGSQSSATIIRSIALNEVKFGDIFKVMWKEFCAGLMLAITLGIVCFAKLQLIDRLLFKYNYTFEISFVVSLCLAITILLSKIVGCALPLLAKKCKLDPAVMASPFITTIVDALSLIIYCNIAIALLG